MTVSVRNAAAWQTSPAGRLLYIRVNGAWRMCLDAWIRGTPTPGAVALPVGTFLDPFDNVSAWSAGASVAGGRTGNGYQGTSLSIGNGGGTHAIPAGQQGDTITVGFAAKFTTLAADNNVLCFYGDAGATLHVAVQLGNARDIFVWRGASAALLGNTSSGTAYPAAGTWFYCEVQVKVHDTQGTVVVRINGTVVLNLINQDTKNAGTGTVIDTVRLTSGHSANGGIIDDFYLAPGAAFLGDINASSPPSNPPTSADSIWHKVADYSAPGMTAPTNLRMYPDAPSNYGAHSSFQVAWDWTLPTNGLNVGDFQVVLTDSAGNWYPGYPVSVAAGSRTYNFTGLNQNTQYQAYVKARYASGGRADSAWAGPLRWKTGADSYVVYDIPVYDWRNEFEYTPPYYYTYTSAALGDGSTWGFGKAIDGNFSSYWNSDVVTEPLGSTQGEGWMVQAPSVDGNGNSYLFTGIRAWTINPHTWWIGIYYNNAWQGGNTVYNGKYTSFRVPYAVGVDQGAAGTNPTIRPGNYQTNSGIFVAGLMQVPGYDGYNWRMEMIELRLLLMQWTLVAYNPRTVAAVNSGPW